MWVRRLEGKHISVKARRRSIIKDAVWRSRNRGSTDAEERGERSLSGGAITEGTLKYSPETISANSDV